MENRERGILKEKIILLIEQLVARSIFLAAHLQGDFNDLSALTLSDSILFLTIFKFIKKSLYSKIAIFSFQKTHEAYTTWFLTCYTSINNNNDFFCIIHRVHQGSEPIKAIKAAKIRINKLKK